MKKICLNCNFADVAFPDIDVRELKEEDNYLICTHTFNIVNARNINNDSGHNLKIEAFRVEDDNTCGMWMKSKSREDDLKMGC